MHKTRPNILTKKTTNNSTSASKVSFNSITPNNKSNLNFNSFNSATIKSPNSNSNSKNNLGKVSPSPNNNVVISNPLPKSRKNIYTNSYGNLNKSKGNEESINLSKANDTNNSFNFNDENKNNKKPNQLEYTFKSPLVNRNQGDKGNLTSSHHKKKSSINLEGEINEANNNGFDQLNGNSLRNTSKKETPIKETINMNNNNNNITYENKIRKSSINNMTFNNNNNPSNTNPHNNLLNTNPINTSGIIDTDNNQNNNNNNKSISKENSNSKEKTHKNQNSDSNNNIKNLTKNVATSKNKVFNLLQNVSKKTVGSVNKLKSTNSKKNINDKNDNIRNTSINSTTSNKDNNNNKSLGGNSNSSKDLFKKNPTSLSLKKNSHLDKKNLLGKYNSNKLVSSTDRSIYNTKKNTLPVQRSSNIITNNTNNFGGSVKSGKSGNTANSQNKSISNPTINLFNNTNNKKNEGNSNSNSKEKSKSKSKEKKEENLTENFNQFRMKKETTKIIAENPQKNPAIISTITNKNLVNTKSDKNLFSKDLKEQNFDGKDSKDLDDDFNFNYNDEKIFSENNTNKQEIIEDDFIDDFKNDLNADTSNSNNNNNNSYTNNNNNNNSNNNIQSASFNQNKIPPTKKPTNFYEPLTSIEEIDEKHNPQGTEENIKSTKENLKQNPLNPLKTEDNKVKNKVEEKNEKNQESEDKYNLLVNFNKEYERKKSKNSFGEINLNNTKDNNNNISNNVSNVSPLRKTFKNEIGLNEEDWINLKPISASNNNNIEKDNNINSISNAVNIANNVAENVSNVNNQKTANANANKGSLTSFNNLSIGIKEEKKEREISENLYQKSKLHKKSTDFEDILALKELIDSNEKVEKKPEKTENQNQTLAKETKETKEKDSKIPNKKIPQRSSTIITNKKQIPIGSKKQTNLSSSRIMNSTLNKDNSSFIEQDSKILRTSHSRSRLKTGGNENSSKSKNMFNKLFEKKEGSKAANTKRESSNSLTTTKKNNNTSTNMGKIDTNQVKSKINTGLSEAFKRKSLTLKQEKKTENANRSLNFSLSQTMNGGESRKPNFISRKNLNFSKANTNRADSSGNNKLSKQSILGKIIASRNIKGDDRSNNLLTDINFEVTNTQQNFKVSRKSLKSPKDSKGNNWFSSLRSDDGKLRRRNSTFPDKFAGKFLKKNSLLPDNLVTEKLNKSMNLENGGKFENLKIRISSEYIISRNKIKDKYLKDKNILKGKYELIESFDPDFMEKFHYEDHELLISPSSTLRLNEKIGEKDPIILPANLRRDQKDELNSILSDKLQGNFIDESITKITKLNRLERMRLSRKGSFQIPTSNYFSPMSSYANGFPNRERESKGIEGNKFYSTESNFYAKSPKENNNNFNNFNNFNSNSNFNSKKISIDFNNNSNFGTFEFNNNNSRINQSEISEHLEIINQNNKRQEKTNQLERIEKTVLNLTKNPSKPSNRISQENYLVLIDNSQGFTLEPKENIGKSALELNEYLTPREKKLLKRIKKLEICNVINLLYQMHPEKNDIGFYSFNNTNEYYSNSGFTLNRQINNNNTSKFNTSKNKQFSVCNQVTESYNINQNANANTNNINIELANNLQIGPGNHFKPKSSKASPNKISFNSPIKFNTINNDIIEEKENDNKNADNLNTIDNAFDTNDNENDNFVIDEKISFAENIKKNINDNDVDLFDRIKKTLDYKRNVDSLKTYEILGIEKDGKFEKSNTQEKKLLKSQIKKEKIVEKGDLNELNTGNLISENEEIIVHPTNANKNQNKNSNNINNSHQFNSINTAKLIELNNASNKNIDNNDNNNMFQTNLELLSEKKKKEASLEYLNQRFNEKLNSLKQKKPYNNTNEIDENLELFKNEFKFKRNYNPINTNSDNLNEKSDNILLTDEKLSELSDKLNGKSEFLDKNQMKNFYKKHLKTNEKSNLEIYQKNKYIKRQEDYWKNNFNSYNNNDTTNLKEKDIGTRLNNLKGILNIEEGKKIKDDQKYQKTQSFLYDNMKGNYSTVNNNTYNNLDISNNLGNLNESKGNNNLNLTNNNFETISITNTNNDKINKLFSNYSTLKFSKEEMKDFNLVNFKDKDNFNKEIKKEKNSTLYDLENDLGFGLGLGAGLQSTKNKSLKGSMKFDY